MTFPSDFPRRSAVVRCALCQSGIVETRMRWIRPPVKGGWPPDSAAYFDLAELPTPGGDQP
jgi:hypothetical protein